jgi:hypothetical protein
MRKSILDRNLWKRKHKTRLSEEYQKNAKGGQKHVKRAIAGSAKENAIYYGKTCGAR